MVINSNYATFEGVGIGLPIPSNIPPYVPPVDVSVGIHRGDISPVLTQLSRFTKQTSIAPDRFGTQGYIASTLGYGVEVTSDLSVATPNYTVIAIVTSSELPTGTPSGWTLELSQIHTGVSVAVYYRKYTEGTSDPLWLLASNAYWQVTLLQIALVDETDAIEISDINTGTTGSPTTNAVTNTANGVLAIAGFAFPTTVAVPYSIQADYTNRGANVGAGFQTIIATKALTATGTQSTAAFLSGIAPNVVSFILIVKKTAVSQVKFEFLGQLEYYQGNISGYGLTDIGTIDLDIPSIDPCYYLVNMGSFIHVYIYDKDNPRSLWFMVKSLYFDESTATSRLIINGQDLRALVANLDTVETTIVQSGTRTVPPNPSFNTSAESWVTEFTNKSILTPTNTPYSVVYSNFQVATSQNRGTTYADPPGKGGEKLGALYKRILDRDGLGYEVVVLNASTTTGVMEFRVINGGNKIMNMANQIVFSEPWETAHAVNVTLSKEGLTAATVYGPTLASSRISFYSFDPAAIEQFGFIYGTIDASSEQYLTQTLADTYLKRALPRAWADVVTKQHPDQRIARDYWLGDKVTCINRDGRRVDELLTSIDITFGQTVTPGFSDIPDGYVAPVESPRQVDDRPPVKIGVGYPVDPGAVGANVSLEKTTYIPGLTTSDGTKIDNAVNVTDGVTPGTPSADNAWIANSFGRMATGGIDTLDVINLTVGGSVIDPGVTKNPQQGVQPTLDTTPFSSGLTQGAVTINDTSVDIGASQPSVQAAFDELIQKYNNLKDIVNAIAPRLITTNTEYDNLLVVLGDNGAKVLGNI